MIATSRKLRIFSRKNLTAAQKINYWSSVIYWYSPIKNLVFLLSPLLFAAFAIPVFRCNWLELAAFWLPMYVMQDVCLRHISRNTISLKWSGIYETSLMIGMLLPILQETFGITASVFKVTDKSGKAVRRQTDWKSMAWYLVLIGLSVFGIIRVLILINVPRLISLVILLFWLIRNLYFLIMTCFLINGRDSDEETVRVIDAEPVTVTVSHGTGKGSRYDGVTTLLTEHKVHVFLDESEELKSGMPVGIAIDNGQYSVEMTGTITNVRVSSNGQRVHTVEILDRCGYEGEYLGLLYDRVPTLPQSYVRDFGIVSHLWQNIAHRVARTRL